MRFSLPLALLLCACGDGAAVQLSAGGAHSCAVREGGSVQCWGSNGSGQLGDGTSDPRDQPVAVEGLDGVVKVDAGADHTCAVGEDGGVWCWGKNDRGQLGDGTLTTRPEAARVAGLSRAIDVSCGDAHSCAVTGDGSTWCWGANDGGQLGGEGDARLPRPVPSLVATAAVEAAIGVDGVGHSCALAIDGAVRCWGADDVGQAGIGGATGPALVAAVQGARSLSLGATHSCAVDLLGRVRCWGVLVVPATLPNGGFVEVAAGALHACARAATGEVWCFGDDLDGQLGDGPVDNTGAAVQVPLPGPARSLAAGSLHSCAQLDDASIWCWGRNADGRLGNGATAIQEPAPVPTEAF